MKYREFNSDASAQQRKRDLQKLGPVDFGDEDSVFARLRRQLRNPSILTFIIVCIVVLTIPVAIAFPGFYKGAQEGIVRIRQEPVTYFLKASTPSWINPYLQRHISKMQNAEVPVEWHGVSFQHGPCFGGNLSQLPDGKYSDAIVKACGDLHDIQSEYAGDCATTGNCNIPPVAVDRLQQVSEDLRIAFSDAYNDYSLVEEQANP